MVIWPFPIPTVKVPVKIGGGSFSFIGDDSTGAGGGAVPPGLSGVSYK